RAWLQSQRLAPGAVCDSHRHDLSDPRHASVSLSRSPFSKEGRAAMTLLPSLVSLDFVYALTGVVLLIFAALTFADSGNSHRVGAVVFWFTLGLIFALGKVMPHRLTGLLVLLLVVLDGAGWVRRGSRQEAARQEQVKQAERLGHKIFLPVLLIPLVTFA